MKNYSYLNYRIIDLLKKEYGDIGIIVGSDLLDKLDTFDNYDYFNLRPKLARHYVLAVNYRQHLYWYFPGNSRQGRAR